MAKYSKFTAIGQNISTEFKKITDLTVNKEYQINKITTIATRYGTKLVISLTEIFGYIFLPNRFNQLSDEEKTELMTFDDKSVFIYKGQSKPKTGTPTSLIEFKPYHGSEICTAGPSGSGGGGKRKRPIVPILSDNDEEPCLTGIIK